VKPATKRRNSGNAHEMIHPPSSRIASIPADRSFRCPNSAISIAEGARRGRDKDVAQEEAFALKTCARARARVIRLLRSASFKIISPFPQGRIDLSRFQNEISSGAKRPSLPEDFWIGLRCLEFPIGSRASAIVRPSQASISSRRRAECASDLLRSPSLPPLSSPRSNDPRARLERMPQCESVNRSMNRADHSAPRRTRDHERERGGRGDDRNLVYRGRYIEVSSKKNPRIPKVSIDGRCRIFRCAGGNFCAALYELCPSTRGSERGDFRGIISVAFRADINRVRYLAV